MVSSIEISIDLTPLDLFLFVWCLMKRYIFCLCSMIIIFDTFLTCFKLSSSFNSWILSFKSSSCSVLVLFLILFNVLDRVFMFLFIVFYICMFI